MILKNFSLAWFRGGFLAAVMACFLLGCGGGADAPETYHVSGTVTFDGKPIQSGQIRFVPDSGEGNSGPPGYAQIKDGKFNTKGEGGKGHVSGPMIVYIDGNDPAQTGEATPDDSGAEPDLEVLFPTYQTNADLPKEDSTQDFEVPAEAANVKSGPA